MKERAVVVLSGGQDSTTCLFWALDQGYQVTTLTFDYQQRHAIEILSAQKIARMAGVSNVVMDVPKLFGASPLISDNTLEQYDDYGSLPKGLENTFVPMRNQLFITLAANFAYAAGISNVVYGNCMDDQEGYPDCRPAFIELIEAASNAGTFTNKSLKIITPLMHMSKKDTILLAKRLPGCMEALAFSHTAYDGKYPPVCKDHASILRARGFEEAGIPDPLVMRAVDEGLMLMPDTINYKG